MKLSLALFFLFLFTDQKTKAQINFYRLYLPTYRSIGVDTSKIDTSVVYLFTKDDDATMNSKYADYYREYKLINADRMVFRIREYWMTGKKKKSYTAKNVSFFNRIGEYKEYNRAGSLIYQTYFDKNTDQYGINQEVGPRKGYYDNGQQRDEEYLDGDLVKYVSFWYSSGRQTLKDGNGYINIHLDDAHTYNYIGKVSNYRFDSIWTGLNPDGRLYCRDEYKHGEFKKGISYDELGNQYKYHYTFENNTANQVQYKLVNDILYNLPYKAEQIGSYWMYDDVPVLFLKKAFVSRVEIRIDGKGVITDVRILKSVNDKADEEVIKAVRQIGKIKPFISRGQPEGGHYVVSLALPY